MQAILLDIDGTLARSGGGALCPNDAPPETVALVQALVRAGYQVILVTGQPASVAIKMREKLGGLSGAPVAPDYGSLVVNGTTEWTLPKNQIASLVGSMPGAKKIVSALGGSVDPRDVKGGLNAFWACETAFQAARENWASAIAREESLALAMKKDLRVQWNSGDYSMNLLPAAAGKGRAVEYLKKQGYSIAAAAGDTGSDEPMLAAALHPIATHDEGEKTHQGLQNLVNARGCGYVAPAEEDHGHGLAMGLLRARELGILRF